MDLLRLVNFHFLPCSVHQQTLREDDRLNTHNAIIINQSAALCGLDCEDCPLCEFETFKCSSEVFDVDCLKARM